MIPFDFNTLLDVLLSDPGVLDVTISKYVDDELEIIACAKIYRGRKRDILVFKRNVTRYEMGAAYHGGRVEFARYIGEYIVHALYDEAERTGCKVVR